jgi:hypothetical protein
VITQSEPHLEQLSPGRSDVCLSFESAAQTRRSSIESLRFGADPAGAEQTRATKGSCGGLPLIIGSHTCHGCRHSSVPGLTGRPQGVRAGHACVSQQRLAKTARRAVLSLCRAGVAVHDGTVFRPTDAALYSTYQLRSPTIPTADIRATLIH